MASRAGWRLALATLPLVGVLACLPLKEAASALWGAPSIERILKAYEGLVAARGEPEDDAEFAELLGEAAGGVLLQRQEIRDTVGEALSGLANVLGSVDGPWGELVVGAMVLLGLRSPRMKQHGAQAVRSAVLLEPGKAADHLAAAVGLRHTGEVRAGRADRPPSPPPAADDHPKPPTP